MATMKVSKLDAARRQLDGAIQLWFLDGDPVAIHSLACAAHQVIQDIAEQKGAREYHLEEITKKIVKPEHVKATIEFVRKPMMFFKHANRDPHAVLEFNPDLSEAFIFLAICCLRDIGESSSDVQRAFLNWAQVHNPQMFKSNPFDELTKRFGVNAIDKVRGVRKSDFLKATLLAIAEFRARSR